MDPTHGPLRLLTVTARPVPVSPKTAWIVVEATLADGATGFGEASLFGQEGAVLAEVEALNARLAADRIDAVGPALDALAQAQMSPARAVLRTGLEAALMDALARRAELPLGVLLGGAYRQRIPVYANINRGTVDRSAEGFARRAREIVDGLGYRAVKIAPFDGLRWDLARREASARLDAGLERIAAVRSAVGAEIDIHVDCHFRLTLATAVRVLAETASLRLAWIEDPMDPARTDPADARAVREAAHRSGTMVAGGERIAAPREAIRLLADGGLDVVLPDLRLTGVRGGLTILSLCAEAGVHASLHNPAGPVLDALSRQVASALPGFLVLERQVGESALYDALRGGAPAPLADGEVPLDAGPGLGFVPDRDALAAASRAPLELAGSFRGIAGAGPDA